MEVLPGERIGKESLHPYTQALMGAVFDLHMDFGKPIKSIEGEAPSPLNIPEGCPFRTGAGSVWKSAGSQNRLWRT